ncbi:MAG: GerMN domain-containing protein [Acidobacteria bacterium]|nr:GerMN domain-containing protein [Acidobacteriota bacterium]
MRRAAAIAWGGAAAVGLGLALLVLVFGLANRRGRVDSPLGGEPGEERRPGAPSAAPAAAQPAAEIEFRPVRIYQRASGQDLALASSAQDIAWVGSPSERAREVVRKVFEAPAVAGRTVPQPPGLRVREVYVDASGTAWVDLEGASLRGLGGSDQELALVASVSRSLTDGIDEVRRVGFLVDGAARASLAGHVDATRTYSGWEWPLAPQGERDGRAAPDAPPVVPGPGTADPGAAPSGGVENGA